MKVKNIKALTNKAVKLILIICIFMSAFALVGINGNGADVAKAGSTSPMSEETGNTAFRNRTMDHNSLGTYYPRGSMSQWGDSLRWSQSAEWRDSLYISFDTINLTDTLLSAGKSGSLKVSFSAITDTYGGGSNGRDYIGMILFAGKWTGDYHPFIDSAKNLVSETQIETNYKSFGYYHLYKYPPGYQWPTNKAHEWMEKLQPGSASSASYISALGYTNNGVFANNNYNMLENVNHQISIDLTGKDITNVGIMYVVSPSGTNGDPFCLRIKQPKLIFEDVGKPVAVSQNYNPQTKQTTYVYNDQFNSIDLANSKFGFDTANQSFTSTTDVTVTTANGGKTVTLVIRESATEIHKNRKFIVYDTAGNFANFEYLVDTTAPTISFMESGTLALPYLKITLSDLSGILLDSNLNILGLRLTDLQSFSKGVVAFSSNETTVNIEINLVTLFRTMVYVNNISFMDKTNNPTKHKSSVFNFNEITAVDSLVWATDKTYTFNGAGTTALPNLTKYFNQQLSGNTVSGDPSTNFKILFDAPNASTTVYLVGFNGQIIEKTITATNIYSVTLSLPTNFILGTATINGSSSVKVTKGQKLSFVANPSPGAYFTGWFHNDSEWEYVGKDMTAEYTIPLDFEYTNKSVLEITPWFDYLLTINYDDSITDKKDGNWAKEYKYLLTNTASEHSAGRKILSPTHFEYSKDNWLTKTTIGLSDIIKIGLENESKIYDIKFRTIYNDGTINRILSGNDIFAYAKVDSLSPIISSNLNYTKDVWTNQNVIITFPLTFGGSGGILEYKLADMSYQFVDGHKVLASSVANLQNANFAYNFSDEMSKTLTVKATSTTGVVTEFVFGSVNIDKTAPQISEYIVNNTVWSPTAKSNIFTITDNFFDDGSFDTKNGFSVNNMGSPVEFTSNNNNYSIVFENSNTYTLTATDKAGNRQSVTYNLKIDTQAPSLDRFDSGDYTPGEWTNRDISILLKSIVHGSSGVAIHYTTNGTKWSVLAPNFGSITDIYAHHDIIFTTDNNSAQISDEIDGLFQFRLVTGANIQSNPITFGYVKLDKTAPSSENYTYTGKWTDVDVTAPIAVYDAFSGVQSVTLTNINTNSGLPYQLIDKNDGIYDVVFANSNVYEMTVTDMAGNVFTKKYSAKIDKLIPSYENFSSSYVFDTWTKDNILISINNLSVGSSGVYLEYSYDNIVWKKMSDIFGEIEDQTTSHALSTTYPSENLSINTDILGNVYMRMVSGNSKATASVNFGIVKLDKTAPTININHFRDSNGTIPYYPSDNIWLSTDAYSLFTVNDNGSANSGVSTVEYQKQLQEKIGMPLSNEYSITMDNHLNCTITATDLVGNITTETFNLWIDKTLPVLGQKNMAVMNGDGEKLRDYVSETWISYNDDMGRAYLNLLFNQSTIGGSGVKLQYKDGNIWKDFTNASYNFDDIAVSSTLNINYDFLHNNFNDQINRQYTIRLLSRSGLASTEIDIGKVCVDKRKITISTNSMISNNAEYVPGVWTDKDIEVEFGITNYGISGYTIFANETDITSLVSNNRYILKNDELNMNIAFTIINGAGAKMNTSEYNFRIDKTNSDLTTTAKSLAKDSTYLVGTWTFGTIEFLINLNLSISGNKVDVYKDNQLVTTFTNITQTSYLVNGEQVSNYKFVASNGLNKIEEIDFGIVKIDDETPMFSIIPVASKNNDWYTSLTYNFSAWQNIGQSGAYVEMAKISNGFTGEFIKLNTELITTDNASIFTYIYQNNYELFEHNNNGETLIFRAVSGSEKVGEMSYENDTSQIVYNSRTFDKIKVDNRDFSFSPNGKVDTKQSHLSDFITSTIGQEKYKRGQIIRFVVNGVNQKYTIKKITIDGVNQFETPLTNVTNQEVSYTVDSITNSNVMDLVIEFFMHLTLNVTDTTQFLQGNTSEILPSVNIQNLGINDNETKFNEWFKNPIFKTIYATGKSPTDIGLYPFTIKINDSDNFVFKNNINSFVMTLRYFVGQGTTALPYNIRTTDDFKQIDNYMNIDSSFDCLGANRKTAVFILQNNLNIENGALTNNFGGTFDGNTNLINTNTSFFNVIDGASIHNVNIKLNKTANVTNDYGILANSALNSTISNIYVFGDIQLSANYNKTFGSVIGKIDNCQITKIVSDTYTSGTVDRIANIGGLVGHSQSSNISESISLSKLIIVCEAYLTNPGSEVRIGGLAGTAVATTSSDNGYLSTALICNKTLTTRAFGSALNQGANTTVHDWESLLNVRGYTINNQPIFNIVKERLSDLSYNEYGNSANPILIQNAQQFNYLEMFFYTNLQIATEEIDMSGMNKMFNQNIPFTGILNGNYNGKMAIIKNFTLSYDKNHAVYGFIAYLQGTIKDIKFTAININIVNTDKEIYVGGAVGIAKVGALISNIIVDGTIEVDGNTNTTYIGGLVAIMDGAYLDYAIIDLTISSSNLNKTIIGGGIAQVQGESNIYSLYSMVKMGIKFNNLAFIGEAVGNMIGSGISAYDIYSLNGSSFVNGIMIERTIANTTNSSIVGSSLSFDRIIARPYINGLIKDYINVDYGFNGGTGAVNSPFVIKTANELKQIEKYMYANFELANDIIITPSDNFTTLGKGAVFSGSLNGKNYAIRNISAPLFDTINGTVRNITLEFAINIVSNSESTIYVGGLAVKSLQSAKFLSITTTGSILVSTPARGSAIVGGICAEVIGSTFQGVMNSVDITVNARNAQIGGAIGIVSQMSTFKSFFNNGNVNVNANIARVGLFIGKIMPKDCIMDEISPSQAILRINGLIITSNKDVGLHM